eukprot:Sspe_Gene.30344::Locus_15012_Transcript_7_15_Confidence_0.206_Length_2566::g.30344::m.30344
MYAESPASSAGDPPVTDPNTSGSSEANEHPIASWGCFFCTTTVAVVTAGAGRVGGVAGPSRSTPGERERRSGERRSGSERERERERERETERETERERLPKQEELGLQRQEKKGGGKYSRIKKRKGEKEGIKKKEWKGGKRKNGMTTRGGRGGGGG